jgi:hypothetical protein
VIAELAGKLTQLLDRRSCTYSKYSSPKESGGHAMFRGGPTLNLKGVRASTACKLGHSTLDGKLARSEELSSPIIHLECGARAERAPSARSWPPLAPASSSVSLRMELLVSPDDWQGRTGVESVRGSMYERPDGGMLRLVRGAGQLPCTCSNLPSRKKTRWTHTRTEVIDRAFRVGGGEALDNERREESAGERKEVTVDRQAVFTSACSPQALELCQHPSRLLPAPPPPPSPVCSSPYPPFACPSCRHSSTSPSVEPPKVLAATST